MFFLVLAHNSSGAQELQTWFSEQTWVSPNVPPDPTLCRQRARFCFGVKDMSGGKAELHQSKNLILHKGQTGWTAATLLPLLFQLSFPGSVWLLYTGF